MGVLVMSPGVGISRRTILHERDRGGNGRPKVDRCDDGDLMSRRLRLIAALFVVTLVAACGATFRNHGYIPPPQDLAQIEIGASRDSVAEAIGRPGVAGITDASGWYYVRSRFRTFAWRAPVEVDRRVLAVSFTPAGTVSNVEEFGLERGRIIRLSRRTTTQNTQGVGFLRQAFGNLGRIDPGTLFGDDN